MPSLPDIRIDFDPDSHDVGVDDHVTFYESIRPWLETQGYFLYNNSYELRKTPVDSAVYSYPSLETDGETRLPYSFFGGDSEREDHYGNHRGPPSPVPGRVAFAQDSQHRHVALKLVKDGSVEYNIYRHLSQETRLFTSDQNEFGCVIPPLDFLKLDGHWFIVMPRWGSSISIPWFSSIGEVLHFIHCCLKGISLLHSHLIVHRDIKAGNMLVNHFGDDFYKSSNQLRPSLRREGRLTYAFFDFNYSVMFSPTSTPSERRLPASESFISFCSLAYDTAQGEVDYDPFAFEVCALGMLLCKQFQHVTTTVPMLAPFLDRMITRKIPLRFTAQEALQFFEEHVLPSVSLALSAVSALAPDRTTVEPELYDRWTGLHPTFVRTWADYRLPPLELSTRVLRWICEFSLGYTVAYNFRRILRAVHHK
ncbi:hypothetical protein HYDPIDRAFT_29727 [Hydnomerulius pinastri MD-312]|uniref:Protein kinase domain-containing protein n=1 Tax=Hydnomerulius pinastri MD-312 TaxID=994086 RepID=A0A0C9WDH2_9AGAM|nr:hypothetical protein HYDPIDRAFT_29727 [Hydnomerulius pinastri MD-312]